MEQERFDKPYCIIHRTLGWSDLLEKVEVVCVESHVGLEGLNLSRNIARIFMAVLPLKCGKGIVGQSDEEGRHFLAPCDSLVQDC